MDSDTILVHVQNKSDLTYDLHETTLTLYLIAIQLTKMFSFFSSRIMNEGYLLATYLPCTD